MVRADEPLRVAVVDGDVIQRSALQRRLAAKGHAPTPFRNTGDLLAALRHGWRFGLLLLNPSDPVAWNELATACRQQGLPVLLQTDEPLWHAPPEFDTLNWNHAIVDFAVQPIADHELEWRMRTLLSRARGPVPQTTRTDDLVCGDYRLLAQRRAVLHRGRELRLDPREFELAFMLFRNSDHLLTRDFLWIALWKQLPRKGARALDIAAAGIRRKLDLREENGVLLRAAYKRGYELLTVTPQAVAPRLALSSS
jgi:DNA-binding response OmpR family regulator